MVDVIKSGEGKVKVTKGDTTMYGIVYCLSDAVAQTITFYNDNNSLTAKFDDISEKYGTENVGDLVDHYLANNFFPQYTSNYFLESINAETSKNSLNSVVGNTTLNNILEELKIITALLKSIAQ